MSAAVLYLILRLCYQLRDVLQLYEIERTANDLMKKQVIQLENELVKSKSERELLKSRHVDRGQDRPHTILVNIHLLSVVNELF